MLFLFHRKYAQLTRKNSPFHAKHEVDRTLSLKSESQTQVIQQVTVLTIIKFAF